MPLSYQNYTGNNNTDTFAIPFTYTATSEISVTVDGVAQTGLTFPSATSVQLTSAPATGTLVQVRRATDLSARAVDYVSGSVLTEEDLDNANIQVFHAAQEAIDTSNDSITLGSDDKWDAQSKVIKNVADPVANTDAVNKQFISTNLPNINTVAGIQSDVTTVANKATEIDVIVNKFDGSTTATSGTNKNLTQVDTVADNIGSVNTVATNITDVVAVANDLNETVSEIETAALDLQATSSKIDTVATNIANVNAVGTDIANVNTVAGDITNVNQLAGALSLQTTFVVTVAGGVFVIDGTSNPTLTLDRGATYIFDVSDSSVAGHPLAFKDGSGNSYTTGVTSSGTAGSANATVTIVVAANAPASLRYYCTVHGNSMGNTISVVNNNLTTVASNITNVNNVGGNITNVNAVATNIAGTNTIGTVATDIANVNNVGNDITNVNAVANNATNINAVAGNATNINAVNNNATNINAVANDATDIGLVATNIANVNAVGTDIGNVNTVASNLTNVNAFADTYFVSATAPASPTTGDLWFDTTNNTMKVYGGSGFQNAGSSVNGTAQRLTYTATAGQTTFAATYDAGYVDVYLNGVKLIAGTDFTATNGTSVVLATGAAVNDTVDIVAYGTFQLSNFSINDANDVNAAGATSGQFLKYDGTNFVADNIPAADVVNDTTPQLGGHLDTNDKRIEFADSVYITGSPSLYTNRAQFGTGKDLEIYGDSYGGNIRSGAITNLIHLDNGYFRVNNGIFGSGYKEAAKFDAYAESSLRYNGSQKLATTTDGIDVTGRTNTDKLLTTSSVSGDFVAEFQNTNAATPYGVWIKEPSSAGNNYPSLTVTDNSGNAHFRVDSGTGRVTLSKQPSFRVQGTGGWSTFSNGSYTTVAFGSVRHNIGNHYSTSTNTFTAPVAGRYIFTLSIYGRLQGGQGDNTNYWYAGFLKNSTAANNTAIVGYQNDGDYDFGYTQTEIFDLAANDTMKVFARAGGSYNGEFYGANCFFGGHLLG